MEEVSHLIIKVDSDGVATATNRLNSMSTASSGLMSSLKGLLTVAAAVSTAMRATQAIAEFSHEMKAVEAVTSASREEMQRLSVTARDLGSQTRFSAMQVAQGMKFLGQAGFTTTQILQAMPGMLDLATAGELDLASASDIASAALAGFSLKASDSRRVADALAVAAAETNTSIFQMGDAMKYVAPISASLGLSIETVSAALGVLSNAGLQGSMAGTGLRQILSSLASPTKEAADTLRAYGVTLDSVNPAMHSLQDIVLTLKKAGLDAAGAFTVFGDRGAPAILALTSQTDALGRLNTSLEKSAGRAREMAKVMGDDLTGDMRRFAGATESLFISLGDAGLGEGLRQATQRLTGFINRLSDMVNSGEAAGWVNMMRDRLGLLADGFENASESITATWGATMEYINGTGRDAANDIVAAFKYMPENIRAAVEGVGATFSLIVRYAELHGRHAYEVFQAYLEFIRQDARNLSANLALLLNPGTAASGLASLLAMHKTSAEQLDKSLANASTKMWDQLGSVADAYEEVVTAVLNERDVNISAADAKIAAIERLRAAYNRLKEERANAEKPSGGEAPVKGAPTEAPGSGHFNVQEFDALRKQLQLEELTVQESYDKRLDLIRRNTKAGSDLRLELERSLAERLNVEMSDAQDATIERLTHAHEVEQAELERQLEQRLITEATYQEKSKAGWAAYTKQVVTVGTKGTAQVSTKQLEMWSMTLGMASNMAGLMSQLVERNTSAGKALFAISKAIAVAEILVNTHVGAAKAVGIMGPFGIPMAKIIMAMGYASAALTAAIAITGHDHGGMIPAGKVGMVGERGVEFIRGPAIVTSTRTTADLGTRGASGGGLVVNVNNYTDATVSTEERDTPNGKMLELVIRRASREVASDIRSGAGPVSGALAGAYNLRRGALQS